MRLRVPPQGTLTIQDIVEYLRSTGALNIKYDANLDGVVDKAADADTVGGHAPGTAAGDVLVLNTAGQVPLTNLPLIPASQLSFGFAWEKIAEIDTSTNSVDLTGLTGDTDKVYLLVIAATNSNTTGSGYLYLKFNGDYSGTNYAFNYFYDAAGTTGTNSQAFGGTTNRGFLAIGGIPANGVVLINCLIYAAGLTAGTTTYVPVIATTTQPTIPSLNVVAGGWIKSAEITSITISTASALNIGWNILLFKTKL